MRKSRWEKIKDNYPYGDGQVHYKEEITGFDYPNATDEEKQMIIAANQICGFENAMYHIKRLLLFKKIDNDVGAVKLIVKEIAQTIMNFSEYAVYTSLEYFKTNDPSPFFPNMAELIQRVKKEDEELKDMLKGIKNDNN